MNQPTVTPEQLALYTNEQLTLDMGMLYNEAANTVIALIQGEPGKPSFTEEYLHPDYALYAAEAQRREDAGDPYYGFPKQAEADAIFYAGEGSIGDQIDTLYGTCDGKLFLRESEALAHLNKAKLIHNAYRIYDKLYA